MRVKIFFAALLFLSTAAATSWDYEKIYEIVLEHDDEGQISVGDDGEDCFEGLDIDEVVGIDELTARVHYRVYHRTHWACYHDGGLKCVGELNLSSLVFKTLECKAY